MNINNSRDAVIQENIATIEWQILALEKWGDATDTSVSAVTSELTASIAALERLKS